MSTDTHKQDVQGSVQRPIRGENVDERLDAGPRLEKRREKLRDGGSIAKCPLTWKGVAVARRFAECRIQQTGREWMFAEYRYSPAQEI